MVNQEVDSYFEQRISQTLDSLLGFYNLFAGVQ
jgi:hypothetical protein